MKWDRFTHEELSMIASEIAIGGAFCCEQNEPNRQTVTSNRRRQEALAYYAHENWGCGFGQALYFNRFLESV